MFKLPDISRKQAGVIITLLVLILLGASYFFIYVPNNEKTVQERRFRCLQNIDVNINSKIDNSIILVNNLLQGYHKSSPSTEGIDANFKQQISTINRYYKDNFTLLPIDTQRTTGRFGKLPGTLTGDLVDVQVDINSDSRQLTLVESPPDTGVVEVRDHKTGLKPRRPIKLGIQFRIGQFIKPLLPANVFDNYIVFYNKNKIYETFPSGLSYKDSDSLLEVKNGIAGPGMRSLKIDGAEYKMFSQPVNIGGGEKWIIAGLVTDKNYQKEKNQLPLGIVLLLLTLALAIIVCFPWIKLYHMGSKDKLTVRDGVASVLVAMVLMSLLFFVFFKYNFNLRVTKDRHLLSSKDSLASKIANNFEKELNNAYQLLVKCDEKYKKDSAPDTNKEGHDFEHDYFIQRESKERIATHQVFWLDRNGIERYNWVVDATISKGSDASAREYFKRVKINKLYRKGTNKFYLDQIISKATGVFTSVISKRSDSSGMVAAMGFTMKSLDTVTMPDGYQYAIIDESGKVLYHYHPELNLNENLKDEFSDSSKLVSSIEAKSDTNFYAEYFGRRYNIKIKPFSGLPYAVVVFEDVEYDDTRDMEAYAFALSMLLCLLAFLVVEFCVVFFASSKKSFFKKQYFETSWIGPKISSHREYNLAIAANLVIIGLMTLFYKCTFNTDFFIVKSSFLEYVYIILFSIILASLVLSAIFARRYQADSNYKYRYKRKAIIYLSVLVLIIDLSAVRTLYMPHFLFLLVYDLSSVTICAIMILWLPKLLLNMQPYKGKLPFKWSYTHSFAMMATTRLIITSGIPVAFFFMYSYDYEQTLDTRYKQYHFAKDLVQRINPEKITGGKLDSIREGKLYNSGIYYDGVSIHDIKVLKAEQVTDSIKRYRYHAEDYLVAKILSAFRFRINSIETKNDNMNLPDIDSVAFFNELTVEKSDAKLSARTFYRISPDKYLLLSSLNTNYKNSNWVLLLAAILLFFAVMHNIIRKLFALDLPMADGWQEMDRDLLTNHELNKLLLIVGSPGSGKLTKIKSLLTDHELFGHDRKRLVYDEQHPARSNVFIADMILIPDGDEEDKLLEEESLWKHCVKEALKDKYGLVIINHFEYNIKDPRTNNMKLELLETLMHSGKSKIMVISTVHPVSFLDSHNLQIRQANKALDQKEGCEDKRQPENDLERWQVIFGHFHIIIERLESLPVNYEMPVMKEIQYSHFLNKMSEVIPDHFVTDTEDVGMQSDSLIFKLQLTSQYFYTYIWQSLTMEEKFLLYDLAEDGLVNSFDDYNLSLLVSKGLIIQPDGTLTLFNKGFRNYILTSIGETEANRIKDQVKANGSWDSLKAPLILTILAILIFLFASQEEAYSRIITYLTAFSAGIPAVLKIFSLFGSGTKKTE